jgi:hypothetical protein
MKPIRSRLQAELCMWPDSLIYSSTLKIEAIFPSGTSDFPNYMALQPKAPSSAVYLFYDNLMFHEEYHLLGYDPV